MSSQAPGCWSVGPAARVRNIFLTSSVAGSALGLGDSGAVRLGFAAAAVQGYGDLMLLLGEHQHSGRGEGWEHRAPGGVVAVPSEAVYPACTPFYAGGELRALGPVGYCGRALSGVRSSIVAYT
jgi:hypothetical protein